MKDQPALKAYLSICAVYLLGIFLNINLIAWLFKPLLVPFLMYAVYSARYFSGTKKLLSALFFSWLGDIVLMRANDDEMYFILGLVLFLISHVFYVILFFQQPGKRKTFGNSMFWVGCVGILAYLAGMLFLLFPTLGEMKIPVALYALTISVMLAMAYKVFLTIKTNERYWIFFGAISFVISDSLLAINKFYQSLPHAAILIMATYLFAQYGITSGLLNHKQNK